jgi:hypothetical protein
LQVFVTYRALKKEQVCTGIIQYWYLLISVTVATTIFNFVIPTTVMTETLPQPVFWVKTKATWDTACYDSHIFRTTVATHNDV